MVKASSLSEGGATAIALAYSRYFSARWGRRMNSELFSVIVDLDHGCAAVARTGFRSRSFAGGE